MYGTEDHHQYVRLLTALELLRHRDAYECTDGILGSLPMATASYSRLVTEAVTMGEYAELSHIYAVSAAYGVVIQSYMPAITVGYDYYTRRVAGRDVRVQSATKFTVMWTMTHVPVRAADFVANHFVLLAERSIASLSVSHDDDADVTDDDTSTSLVADLPSVSDDVDTGDGDVSTTGVTELPVAESVSAAVDADSDDNTTAVVTELPAAESVTDLPRSDGLNTVEVLDILRRTESDRVLSRIPRGRKDNVHVYCVVSNTANVQRKHDGKNNAFVDDCGAWQSNAHGCNYPYLLDDSAPPKRIFLPEIHGQVLSRT